MTDDDAHRVVDTHELADQRRAGSAVDREAWIAVSRQLFDPGERCPCMVCGKFKSIAQAHHVVPLTSQYDRGYRQPDQTSVWLCPNHHVMVHLFIPSDDRSLTPAAIQARDKTIASLNDDLSAEEFSRMLELMHLSGRSPG